MITKLNELMIRLRTDESGLTSVEYAVLGAIVVGAIVAVGTQFNQQLAAAFAALFAQAPGGVG